MIFAESPRRQTVTRLVSWGHWYAFFNIIIALVIASIYVFSAPLPSTLLGQVYLFSNWFGHISFITFIGFVLLVLPMCYAMQNARFVKGFAAFVSAVALALLAFDALLFNRTGLHLSFSSSALIVDETAVQIAHFNWQEWTFLILLFVVWLSFQILMANALWKRIERFSRKRIGQSVIGLFLLSFVGSHALHIWADARLYQPIMQQDNMFPLSYPATAKTTLSRYGLLDMADYTQQKSVQFTYSIDQLDYPKEPVYCPIDNTQKWVVVYVTDSLSAGMMPSDWHNKPYFRPQNSIDTLVKTTLFSLPNLYHHYLIDTAPVLLDVLAGFKLPVNLYSPSNTGIADTKINTFDYAELLTAVQNTTPGVTFGFVSSAQLPELLALNDQFANATHWLVLSAQPDQDGINGQAWSNQQIAANAMVDEDIVPSVFAQLGCEVPPAYYSTGQNVFTQPRDWQITTQNDAVILITDEYIAKIKHNGLTEIQSKQTGNVLNQQLDTDMFNRAIKHLSQFSQIK